jgi:hypothetical protein
MQKRILSIFCPFFIAIIVRLIYVLWGYGFLCAGYVADKIDWAKSNMNSIGFFDTFNWDVSWHYWGIVLILTFLAEMDIWRDPKDDYYNCFSGHSIYGLIFLVIIILFFIPSISSFLFAGGGWLLHIILDSNKPITVSNNILYGCFTVIGLGTLISCWKHENMNLNEVHWNWLGVIMGVMLVGLVLFGIITPAFGYVVTSIIFCGIYFSACCIW